MRDFQARLLDKEGEPSGGGGGDDRIPLERFNAVNGKLIDANKSIEKLEAKVLEMQGKLDAHDETKAKEEGNLQQIIDQQKVKIGELEESLKAEKETQEGLKGEVSRFHDQERGRWTKRREYLSEHHPDLLKNAFKDGSKEEPEEVAKYHGLYDDLMESGVLDEVPQVATENGNRGRKARQTTDKNLPPVSRLADQISKAMSKTS
jgi:predicted RNase H-like nuclease (RuvC/YqgF family)